ncbi:MAG: outer membrane lipid asymmetry maintenance protein MlaD [Myxococcota bacterium]|nr:outer membrane lipid asymmetry maintenance protein MlaD [Myxococcota bacterium]
MQQTSSGRDLAVGVFVFAGIAALAYLSVQVGGLSYSGPRGFEVVATFDDVGGLSPRSPAMISGVKVGQVKTVQLDETLRARVVMDLDPSLDLPVDTSAAIRTQGLLGDQFIALEPGAEDDLLLPGEEIVYTDSALNLESLIGRVVHNTGIEDSD